MGSCLSSARIWLFLSSCTAQQQYEVLCRSGTDYTREYDSLTPYFSRNFSSMTADTSSNGLPMPRIDLTSPVILAKRCKCGSSYKKETQSAITVTMYISRDAGCNQIDHDASRRCGRAIEESTTELVPHAGLRIGGLPNPPQTQMLQMYKPSTDKCYGFLHEQLA